ncbi:MAG TPA: tetratricopeptide repeat protein [Actinospica sp.]|nr:tetratricopeptide repeat protein [Actinospica sp.]
MSGAGGERSVSVAHNHGIVSTGDYATNTLINLPRGLPSALDTQAPPRTARLGPGRGNAVFVGRARELARLSAAGGGARVLVGLGGCGKSTLAEVFTRRRCASDNPVWWIDARTAEQIETGLAELALRLDPVFSGLPVPVAAAWARSWLAAHEDWLLVLDDVPGPAEARSLLRQLPHGRFLLTSRQGAGWSGLADVVRLGELDGEQAVEMLEEMIRTQSVDAPDLTGAAELCERLGRLPLAIEQAGAFIAVNSGSPRGYLDLLEADSAQLLDGQSADGNPAHTVARTWRVTLDRLADSVGALAMIRVLAWFAPNDIPRVRIPSGPEAVANAKAVNQLAAYHLVSLTPKTISVHPLVQEILRTPDESDPHRSAADTETARQTAITLLRVLGTASFTGTDPGDWPARRRLFPHIEVLLAHTAPERDDEGLLVLCRWLGQSLFAQGDFRGAHRHLARCVEGLVRLFGPDHIRTLEVRIPLGQSLRALGDREAAAQVHRDTYERAARSLGPAHETTLIARVCVAGMLSAEGAHDEAIAELRAVFATTVEEYGPEHALTDLAENNLASALSEAGRLDEAVESAGRHLRTALARYGPDSVDALGSQHNYATALLRAGELERGIALLEEVVEGRTRLLGEDHPDTLISLGNLAAGVIESRDLERGRRLLERGLRLREQTFGPDHPNTLDSRRALTMLDQLSGRSSRD